MADITRIYYNKLVRDNIPDMIKAKHMECGYEQITDIQEFQQELFKKIREEATSLAMTRSKKDFLEEYADLMMVLETAILHFDFTKEELKQARLDNHLKKGGYKKQNFLKWSGDVKYQSEESPQGIPL
jgi:predicted house-cleaning noncanonical NTP pyrophosphatase (MazG superfamily)